MFRFVKTIRYATAAIVLGIGAAAATSAHAIDLLPRSSSSTTTLNALMQPIQPFVANSGATTSSITQIGRSNFASAEVSGRSNLTVIDQGGQRNRAIQAIQGSSSALLLVQGGRNNSVVQASVGNRNLQLVGVSGNDNSVAYIQAGNDLAGALDVRDAKNSTVVALQTPQSGRYLQPTGLRGIQNKVVVIVPGRMYVFSKR